MEEKKRKPRGPNKTTKEMRETVTRFTTENFEDFTKAWKDIKSNDRKCSIYLDLLKFALPSLSSVGIGSDDEMRATMSDYLRSLRDSNLSDE